MFIRAPKDHSTTAASLYFGLFHLHPVRADRADLSRAAVRSVLPIVAVLVLGVVLSQMAGSQPAVLAANAAIPVLMALGTLGWVRWLFRIFPEGRTAPFDLALPIALTAFAGACLECVVHAVTGGWHGSLSATLGHMLKVTLLWSGVGLAATAAILFICARGPVEEAHPEAVEHLTLAGKEVLREHLVMLEAKGNSVILVTVAGRETVPGPLADRIEELPAGLGKLIHRSVWVAAHAVQGYSRKGRDVIVDLAGGHRAVAASSRLAEVLPWLRSLTGEGALRD
jgi:hypothetical protein